MVAQPEIESPTGESPLDGEDSVYPCKGCGEILEEGKAFELAGKRWHIDCFRCNTCGTFLDSDANLLLLGDGSLICNNCTYSCSSCGNKIEDLAILTGDQAFCAQCFKCRNCKRKIENLRYARTSQGIFCMDCHESLMARRRKRTARNAAQRHKVSNNPNAHLDKSLPSLPPTVAPPAVTPDSGPPSSDPYADTPSDHAPRSREEDRSYPRHERKETSNNQENLILPSSTYRSNRHSISSHKSDASGGGEEFLIPVAFDPTPSEHHSPAGHTPDTKATDEQPRDYFGRGVSADANRRTADRHPHLQGPSRSESPSSEHVSPHIAYQEKRRAEADPARKRQENNGTPSATDKVRQQNATQKHSAQGSEDRFRLQDVPRGKRLGASSQSEYSGDDRSQRDETPRDLSRTSSLKGGATTDSNGQSHDHRAVDHSSMGSSSTAASSVSPMQYPPKRGDSLDNKFHHSIQRKDLGHTAKVGEPGKQSFEGSTPVGAAHDRTVSSAKDQYTPRRASQQSSLESRRNHNRNESSNTVQSESQRQADAGVSPSLLHYSTGGDFSMDDDMARIMGSDDAQAQESFLRRVSNSVRHGRSFSDKGARLSKESKWPKSPNSSSYAQDISSPNASSPENRDEIAWFKNELRRERQKVVEKDQKIAELEASLNAAVNIKQVNTELREKRSTMVFLDAQKEIVLRELEVLTEHIAAEKQSGKPLDLAKVSNTVVREFAESIQKLKDSFAPQIEELIQKRNELLEELSNLGRMKDKSFQEFEQLSLKNAQLAELNNQLVHQIQELYKANSNSNDGKSSNGLGIYSHQKDKSSASIEVREARPSNDLPPGAQLPQDELEPVTVLQGPQVVNIRKGQPRKFNWKRGGQNVAKGVTKGLKGAFNYGEGRSQRDGQFNETAPYGSMSQEGGSSGMPRSQSQDPARQGFGFFGNQKNKQQQQQQPGWKGQTNGSSPALVDVSASAAGGLFGSDLEQRLEVEKGVIPAIVTRCIEEVELRGMDAEGIYRKSGGSSQVQMIRDGFERTPDYDISDPDLDIHAVTSALKQYFRKLPTPLITFDVYDKILDANSITATSTRIDEMQRSLHDLPRVHRDVLEFLIFHLKRVVDREKENLMTSMNIAVVFAPTILRPESLSREMTDVQKKNEALQFLVENCQEIFMGIEE